MERVKNAGNTHFFGPSKMARTPRKRSPNESGDQDMVCPEKLPVCANSILKNAETHSGMKTDRSPNAHLIRRAQFLAASRYEALRDGDSAEATGHSSANKHSRIAEAVKVTAR